MTNLDFLYIYAVVNTFVVVYLVNAVQELKSHVNILNSQNRELARMVALATSHVQEE